MERLDQLREERKAVDLQISRLSKRLEELKAEADALKEDPQQVERAARDELGLVRRTEVVYLFDKRATKPVGP